MSRKLTIPYYRPTFVAKTAGEVGDGTEWPLPVTLDQLAEIMYRVKDAWFTAGDANYGGAGTISFQGGTPAAQFVNSDDDGSGNLSLSARSYYALDPVPAEHNGRFLTAYSVEGVDFRDFSDDELAIWIPTDQISLNVKPSSDGWLFGPSSAFACGFSHYTSLWGVTTSPAAYCIAQEYAFAGTYEYCSLWVVFSGEVAFTGSADPMAPEASLYIGVEFGVYGQSGTLLSSLNEPGSSEAGFDFSLVLSSSQVVSCKIYDPVGSPLLSGSDFVLTAKEWWPYNTESDGSGSPIWDTTTGMKL